jgi:hypothetical protein
MFRWVRKIDAYTEFLGENLTRYEKIGGKKVKDID